MLIANADVWLTAVHHAVVASRPLAAEMRHSPCKRVSHTHAEQICDLQDAIQS